jgi:hypothetical protein
MVNLGIPSRMAWEEIAVDESLCYLSYISSVGGRMIFLIPHCLLYFERFTFLEKWGPQGREKQDRAAEGLTMGDVLFM